METNDKPKFAALMDRLAEVFQQKLSPLFVEEYFNALKKYPIRQVIWAGEECIKDCLFFPKPAEIIKAMFAGESTPAEYIPPRKLPEPRDPEVRAKYLAAIKELVDKSQFSGRPPRTDLKQSADKPRPTESRMTESNWRAKWDMGKIHPDLLILRENIPARLKKQFSEEDKTDQPLTPTP